MRREVTQLSPAVRKTTIIVHICHPGVVRSKQTDGCLLTEGEERERETIINNYANLPPDSHITPSPWICRWIQTCLHPRYKLPTAGTPHHLLFIWSEVSRRFTSKLRKFIHRYYSSSTDLLIPPDLQRSQVLWAGLGANRGDSQPVQVLMVISVTGGQIMVCTPHLLRTPVWPYKLQTTPRQLWKCHRTLVTVIWKTFISRRNTPPPRNVTYGFRSEWAVTTDGSIDPRSDVSLTVTGFHSESWPSRLASGSGSRGNDRASRRHRRLHWLQR